MEIAGTTRVYGVIGDPVAHSLSPFLMNRALAACGVDAVYVAFPASAERFDEALAGLRSAGLAGLNVTYPHKKQAFLAAQAAAERATLLRAANTLTFTDGAIWAENTDAPGAALALETFGPRPAGRRVLIVGAGGAGRAAALGLLEAGARTVTFAARDRTRAGAAIASLVARFGAERILLVGVARDRAAVERAARDAEILIQATPVGMAPATGALRAQGALPTSEVPPLLEDGWISAGQCCFDFVYHPLETPFLAVARARGAQCVDGLALLVSQARESFALWTGRSFDLRAMHAAVVQQASGVGGEG